MKKSIYQQLMLLAILLIITKDVNSACSTGKWCSGSTFSPPPVFYTVEGAISISNKGYVRGSYSTSNMYAYPAACSSSSSSNNNQFSNLNTKFQQVGDSADPINSNDWFYIPYGDFNANKCTASFSLKQQLLIQGSYEGCIAELYFYYNSGWYVDRRLHTVGYTIDSTTGKQKVMFYTTAEKSFSLGTDTNIPCFKRDLYYHPYKRFFFYYYDNTKIVAIDRGFGSSTGDACTNAQTPSSINFYTIPISSISSILKPVYYGGFAYIPMWHSSNGWDVSVDSTGLITSSAFVNILTSPSTKKFDSVAGMRDVGIFFIYNGQVGYYLQKINSADGTASGSILTKDSTYTWKLFQANYNVETDLRPVYASPSNEPNKYYKATNVLNLDFTDSASKYDFFTYPVSFGKYYAMELRPGTCAQENGGSEDYNYLHVNVLSLRDKAHVTCIDDSTDIYCGNGKWEAYNCEACDDNNVSNNDGCSSTCQVETRWVCTSVVNATSVCTYTACGNSYLDSGETCDDGNTANGDGCSSTCQIENCYMCTGVGAGSCTLACKNGAIGTVRYNGVSSTEVCDEGVGADALGCLNCCTTIQTGYKCGAAGTECYLRCGDSVLDTGTDAWGNTPEKCDDGK